jgi:hypothetical protein
MFTDILASVALMLPFRSAIQRQLFWIVAFFVKDPGLLRKYRYDIGRRSTSDSLPSEPSFTTPD